MRTFDHAVINAHRCRSTSGYYNERHTCAMAYRPLLQAMMRRDKPTRTIRLALCAYASLGLSAVVMVRFRHACLAAIHALGVFACANACCYCLRLQDRPNLPQGWIPARFGLPVTLYRAAIRSRRWPFGGQKLTNQAGAWQSLLALSGVSASVCSRTGQVASKSRVKCWPPRAWRAFR